MNLKGIGEKRFLKPQGFSLRIRAGCCHLLIRPLSRQRPIIPFAGRLAWKRKIRVRLWIDRSTECALNDSTESCRPTCASEVDARSTVRNGA